jgi:hypothetical protein
MAAFRERIEGTVTTATLVATVGCALAACASSAADTSARTEEPQRVDAPASCVPTDVTSVNACMEQAISAYFPENAGGVAFGAVWNGFDECLTAFNNPNNNASQVFGTCLANNLTSICSIPGLSLGPCGLSNVLSVIGSCSSAAADFLASKFACKGAPYDPSACYAQGTCQTCWGPPGGCMGAEGLGLSDAEVKAILTVCMAKPGGRLSVPPSVSGSQYDNPSGGVLLVNDAKLGNISPCF